MTQDNQMTLTRRQREALNAIEAFIDEHGVGPSISELGQLLGIAVSPAHRLMKQLERRGHLEREYGRPRSMRVLRR